MNYYSLLKHMSDSYLIENSMNIGENYSDIIKYTYQWDEILNNGLRTMNMSVKGYEFYNEMMAAMNDFPPTDIDRICYRGIKEYPGHTYNDIVIGEFISERGFSSFTINKEIADIFRDENGYIIEVTMPAGNNALYFTAQTGTVSEDIMEDEYEIVFQPGLMLEIVDKRIVGGIPMVYCEFMGYADMTDTFNVNIEIDTFFDGLVDDILSDYVPYIIEDTSDHKSLYSKVLLMDDESYDSTSFKCCYIFLRDKIETEFNSTMYRNYIKNRLAVIRVDVNIEKIKETINHMGSVDINYNVDGSVHSRKSNDMKFILQTICRKELLTYGDDNVIYEKVY